jgi:hypothetical protein
VNIKYYEYVFATWRHARRRYFVSGKQEAKLPLRKTVADSVGTFSTKIEIYLVVTTLPYSLLWFSGEAKESIRVRLRESCNSCYFLIFV